MITEAIITVRRVQEKRTSVWALRCSACGELENFGKTAKVDAAKTALSHAETVHNRKVQIRMPA